MSSDIVIVGAAGFLGHRLCALAPGRNVTGLCRHAPLRDLGGASPVIGDRRDPETLACLLEGSPAIWIDTAVNDETDAQALVSVCAAIAGRGLPLPRFIIASSIGEYAPSLAAGTTITEDSATSPDDTHSAGKLSAYDILARDGGPMSITWAILPMMWGPGDHDGTGPGGRTRILIENLRATGRIEFSGTCDNPIPDGFVDTIAAALLFVSGLPADPGIRRMLIAGPDNLTPRGFVEEAGTTLGIHPEIVVKTPEPGSRQGIFPGSRVVMDCSRLYATGFKPADDWREGVRKTTAAAMAEARSGVR